MAEQLKYTELNMSHWAEIDSDNKVIRVIVGDNALPDEGEAFVNSLGGTWVKTSYNGTIRGKFAGVGDDYDPVADIFIGKVGEKPAGLDIP